MAKTKEAGGVYQLKITLRDIKPPVWRRVQVKDCTLGQLNDIIQTCMGWFGGHLHAFEIGGEQYGEPDPDGTMETEDERKVKLSQVVNGGIKKFTYT
ncbi:MAG: plasmid pRiA4b ORF-3 family protein, partial [Gemmataceae bacterium]